MQGLCKRLGWTSAWIGLWWLLAMPGAWAGGLSDRVAAFPDWQTKPPTSAVGRDDLAYPEWMAGTWQATSTLRQMEAPLSPTLETPGFESNRTYVDRPLQFNVRFQPADDSNAPVVADRDYNGKNITEAYLGSDREIRVFSDPDNPNRQVTELESGRQLLSVVRGRRSERPNPDRFLATEVTYQLFRTSQRIYFNEVETTTDYRKRSGDRVTAQQLTAIYLSPKDPDYFRANGQPVALYRYDLQLDRLSP